ncbi:odorant receptor 85c-like [Aricia agestis]|uniref:odorant receptor 85c-like n=1 Tax=Aricia agestis TaxID=91739 RepID=UPI001C20A17C|nr:odorant receptor 85c-like [Aricia agestis]
MSTGKAICLYLNQGTLKSVLDTFEDLYPVLDENADIDEDDRVTEEEKKVVSSTMKLIYTSIGVLGTFISMVVLSFILLPIVLILYIYFTTGNFEHENVILEHSFLATMVVKKDFNKSAMYSIFWLKLSGITMDLLDTKKPFNYFATYYLYYFNCLFLFSHVAGEVNFMIDAINNGKSVIDVAHLLPLNAITFLSIAKSCFLFFNQGVLKSILDRLEEYHPSTEDADKPNDREQKLVAKSVKTIVFSTYTLGLIVSIMIMTFFIIPIAIMAHSYLTSGEIKYITPFLVKYFFNIDNTFNWAVIYIHHIWTTLVVCGNVYGADILILLFCCYIKMHFELIGKRFEGVINDDSLETTQKNIRKLIMRHQSILNLVEAMDVLFSKATLIQCVISSIMICFCLFTATFTESTLNLITFALFLFMILVEMMMLCYFGDMLISASTEFGDDVYRCAWYNAHPSIMKDLIFILQRSQTPCKITALGFADLRLMTFTSILSSSWSYYALIRTMYE